MRGCNKSVFQITGGIVGCGRSCSASAFLSTTLHPCTRWFRDRVFTKKQRKVCPPRFSRRVHVLRIRPNSICILFRMHSTTSSTAWYWPKARAAISGITIPLIILLCVVVRVGYRYVEGVLIISATPEYFDGSLPNIPGYFEGTLHGIPDIPRVFRKSHT